MLVVGREVNEGIWIPPLVHIIVVSVYGKRAKIGIDAPREVLIYRDEVYDKIRATGQIPVVPDTLTPQDVRSIVSMLDSNAFIVRGQVCPKCGVDYYWTNKTGKRVACLGCETPRV